MPLYFKPTAFLLHSEINEVEVRTAIVSQCSEVSGKVCQYLLLPKGYVYRSDISSQRLQEEGEEFSPYDLRIILEYDINLHEIVSQFKKLTINEENKLELTPYLLTILNSDLDCNADMFLSIASVVFKKSCMEFALCEEGKEIKYMVFKK